MIKQTRSRRALGAGVVAAALVLAACGTADDETTATTVAPADTEPATTEAPTDTGPTDTEPPTTEAAPETTADPGPPEDLLFGFNLSSGDINATRQKYGVEGQNTNLLPEDYYVALIDAYNAEGGIAGHTIVPVTYTAPTGDVPSDVVNQERCETFFGGDSPAHVVAANNDPIINTCAQEAGAIVFGAGFTGLDQAALDEFAGHVNPQAATFDEVARAMVGLAVDDGVVTEGSTVGVIYPGCEPQTRVYDNALLPALEDAGATVSTFEGTCIRSSADEGAAVAELPNAILQFKSDGATSIFNLATGFIGVALLMNEAEGQGFSPTWVLSTNNEFGALTSMGPPANQLANTLAVGWSAALDTFELDAANVGPEAPRCLGLFESIGFPPPSNLGEFATQLGVCSNFFALEIMLEATPGAIDRDQMLDALAASTVDSATLTNSVDWTSGRQPNNTYRRATFDPAVGQFVYTGDPTPMSGG